MKYKMVAIDFDGTTYTDDYKISDRTVKALAEYTSKGGKIVIATGRLFSAIKPHADFLGLKGEIVVYQGGGVYDIESSKQILETCINKDLAIEVFKFIEKQFLKISVPMFFYKDKCHVSNDSPYIRKFSEIVKIEPVILNMPLSEYLIKNDFNPTKILILTEESMSLDLVTKFKNNFTQFNVNRSSANMVEIVNSEVSKGFALKWLCEKYNINREDTIAIGDAENDISMLEYAGLGVAMGNAMDTVKKVADYITDTNNNDGVAKVIEKFCLSDK